MGNLNYSFWEQICLFKGIFKVYEGAFFNQRVIFNLKVGCIYKTFGDKNRINLETKYEYLVAF